MNAAEPQGIGQTPSVVAWEARNGGLLVTIRRPQAGNAMNPEVLEGLRAAVEVVRTDTSLRCLVIAGAPRVFCAGADLDYTSALLRSGDIDAVAAFLGRVSALLDDIEQLPVPVVAAVDGAALAGGFELVLACDLVLATTRARFGDAHVAHGFIPGWHSTVRAPRKLGPALARRLILSGETVDASALGSFVTEVVEPDHLDATVAGWMARFAANGPTAMATAKALLHTSTDTTAAEAARRETEALRHHLATAELWEGSQAFLERRAPRFPDRVTGGSGE